MKAIKRAIAICCIAAMGSTMAMIPADAAQGVVINEVCAKNTTYAASDGQYYDWVELYNNSGSAVDISGWGFSDKEDTPYRYTFPAGTVIQAGGRMVFYCDGTAGETNTAIAPFGLSTSGETLILTDKSGNQASKITFDAMAKDTSYGLYPDGGDEYFTLPCTPGTANTAPSNENAVNAPVFSAESGFYGSNFSLTLSAAAGTTIYYTTDGSDPTTSSERYTGPISITDMTNTPNRLSARTDITPYTDILAPDEGVVKAAIIRAIAVDSQGRVSSSSCGTYFLGQANQNKFKNMKVISMVTDPDNLFDYDKGIYCLGATYGSGNGGGFGGMGDFAFMSPANYKNKGAEWERPANIQVFENGQSVLQQDVGIRIKGAASRAWAQKSFNIFPRKEYSNTNELAFDFFDGKATKAKNGKTIKTFGGITIRNGGNDNMAGYFRDSLNQSLVADRDMATQATSEALLFIDGEFWGIYQVMEKYNDDYFNAHYGVKKNNITYIKNGELEEGEQSGLSDWNSLVNMISGDIASDSVYQQVCEKLDVQSIIDYFAAQMYWGNHDWPGNNTGYWKATVGDPNSDNVYEDGKWRMVLFDTEYSSNLADKVNEVGPTYNSFNAVLGGGGGWGGMGGGIGGGVGGWGGMGGGVGGDNGGNAGGFDWGNMGGGVGDNAGGFDWSAMGGGVNINADNDAGAGAGGGFDWGGLGGGGGFDWGGMGGFGGSNLGTVFSNLMKNESFKKQFELTFMDLVNYNFDPQTVTEKINYYKQFKEQVLDTYKRFPSSKNAHNEMTYNEDYQLLQTFYNTRADNVVPMMKTSLSLTGELATVSVRNDGNKGSIKFNTLNLPDSLSSWSGKYYTDYPVTVKAEAKDGYVFDHWTVTGATVSGDLSSPEINVPVSNGVSIEANYKQGAAPVVTTTTTTTTRPTTTSTTTTAQPPVANITYGDSNCDGNVTIADAAALLQYLGNGDKFPLSEQGKKNADVDGVAGITTADAVAIQKYKVGIVSSLPLK